LHELAIIDNRERIRNMEISRRDFLKAAGAGAAGAVLLPSILDGDLKAFAREPVKSKPIVWERVFHHACGICDSVCGTMVYVKDGRIKWIEGNPADNLGGHGNICVKGASAMRHVYDPDRLKWPLKRTNPKKGKDEDPGWVQISWEEAFDTIAKKFNDAIRDYGPQSILLITRPKTADTRLKKAIGTPNLINHVDTCYSSHQFAWMTTTGKGRPWSIDLQNAKYILSFGWDMPGKSKQCYLQPFLAAKDNRAKIVVFDPKMSLTAAKANEWIPIKPGTDLAVVLAMINVIVSENLYDKDYVDKYTTGLDKLAEHVKQYTPEWASQISGVQASDIVRIARELATTKPAVIPTHKRDAGGPNYINSFQLARAEIVLSALIGSIEKPGGFYFPRQPKVRSMDEFAPVKYPEMKETRRIDGVDQFPLVKATGLGNFGTFAHGLTSAIEKGEPYPVKVALVNQYNLLSFPNPDLVIDALIKLDFMAVVDILPSEMAQLADVLLPEPHFLERSGMEIRSYQSLWPQVLFREGIGTLWDEKGWDSIVNGILEAMGKTEFKVDWTALEEAQLEDIGISEEYLKEHNGIWEDKKEPTSNLSFSTPSKKIEFYSSTLEKEGYEPLPTWYDKKSHPSAQYPFYFIITRNPWARHGKLGNDPILMELQPSNFLHMHPDAAARLKLKEGDCAFVTSPTGHRLKMPVHITRNIRVDCVATEHGYGHWSKELRFATGCGTNDGDLIPEMTIQEALGRIAIDPSMSTPLGDVCVGVEKA
jgi:thiosulfate reductase/polysulfide reductase chain A